MYIPDHKARPGRPFLTILAYDRPYLREYATGAALALTFSAIELALPLVIRSVVAAFDQDAMTMPRLWLYFGLLVGIAGVTGFGRYHQRKLMIGASRKSEFDLRNDYFRHLQRLGRDFFQRTQTGDIMARAVNDLNYVRMLNGPGIMGSVDMCRLPLSLVLMLYFSARLTLVTAVPLPFVSITVYLFVMFMHRQSLKVQEQFSRVTARAQENLAGARVVKAYAASDTETRDFYNESRTYMRETMKLAVVMAFAFPFIGAMVALTVLLVIWQGGLMVIDGAMAFANLMGFMTCLVILAWPLVQFGWVLTLYQRGAVSMNRISEIFAEAPSIRDDENTLHAIRDIKGDIEFDNVSFSYAGGEEDAALKELSFKVPSGGTVAIVGPTGSGKSSIVALIAREYDATAGHVLVDDVDVRRIPLETLRRAIGYVPQDTFLFSDTVRANIALGYPDAPADAIDYACEVAQFSETVANLENGYDTLLGERGVNLSGGQKQRLAIARAVLRDPKVLILDDALSSVDTQTEEEILMRLKDVMKTRTSIIIAHRVSSVRHADEIFVIDDGRLVERGTHAELAEAGGLYSEMHERQKLEEELEES